MNKEPRYICTLFIKIFPIFDIFYKNLDYLDKKNKNKQNQNN